MGADNIHSVRTTLDPCALLPPLGRRSMSGIFRDSFQNVVELLDDCFQVRCMVTAASCCV